MLGNWMCVCVQVRKCRYVYVVVVVVVAAACFAVLARAVRLSLAMLPRLVVRQQRKSGRGQLAERLCRILPLGPLEQGSRAKLCGAAALCRRTGHATDAAGGSVKKVSKSDSPLDLRVFSAINQLPLCLVALFHLPRTGTIISNPNPNHQSKPAKDYLNNDSEIATIFGFVGAWG